MNLKLLIALAFVTLSSESTAFAADPCTFSFRNFSANEPLKAFMIERLAQVGCTETTPEAAKYRFDYSRTQWCGEGPPNAFFGWLSENLVRLGGFYIQVSAHDGKQILALNNDAEVIATSVAGYERIELRREKRMFNQILTTIVELEGTTLNNAE